jgi:hypothetical protein
MEAGIFREIFAIIGSKATFGLGHHAQHKTGVIQGCSPKMAEGGESRRCGAAFSQNSP